MLSIYIMISSFVSILGSYLCKKLVRALTARKTFLFALLFMAACSGAAFLRYEHMYEVIVLMSLVQLGFGIIIASQPMLYSDVIIFNEWKTGKNAAGWITGLQMVPLNVGIVSRGIIISACLALANFDPNNVLDVVPPELKTGICVAFMIIPGIVLLAGALISSIAAEMQDAELKGLIERIGYDEGMPVVTDPGIIKPADFIAEVVGQRFPNPFIPDTPQRIATDTSQKIPIRFGETIKSYIASDELDVKSLTFIPLAIAGWLRYLLGVDDKGETMEVSSDPMLETLQQQLAGIELGKPASVGDKLRPILSNEAVFAADLVACGLADKIEEMFGKLIAGPGAVRATLQEYLRS